MITLKTKQVYEILQEWTVENWVLTDGTVTAADIKGYMEHYGLKNYLYPETADPLEKWAADWNFYKSNPNFDRLYSAMTAEYKPLENYSMTEIGTDKRSIDTSNTHTSTEDGTDTGTISNSGTNTRTDDLTTELKRSGTVKAEESRTGSTTDGTTETTTNTGTVGTESTGSTTEGVSVYDVSTYSNRTKNDTTSSDTRTDNTTETTTRGGKIDTTDSGTTTTTNDTTDTTAQSGTVKIDDTNTTTRDLANSKQVSATDTTGTKDNNDHQLTRSGNIGVTTSQQMLESEIKLRLTNNFVQYVVDGFMSNYTIWGDYE